MNNSLLALLLTLPDLESPLSPKERKSLQRVGAQLDADPKAWESHIEPKLLKIVQDNETWNQKFTATKAQLDDLGDEIKEFLPSQEEIDRIFPSNSVQRGKPKGDPNDPTYGTHIKNVSISILENPDPQSASQKSQEEGLFKKLKEKLGWKGEEG